MSQISFRTKIIKNYFLCPYRSRKYDNGKCYNAQERYYNSDARRGYRLNLLAVLSILIAHERTLATSLSPSPLLLYIFCILCIYTHRQLLQCFGQWLIHLSIITKIQRIRIRLMDSTLIDLRFECIRRDARVKELWMRLHQERRKESDERVAKKERERGRRRWKEVR